MKSMCKARTRRNKLCKARAVKNGLCSFHADHDGGEARKNWWSKKPAFSYSAGPARNPPRNANDLKELLATAICRIHAGKVDPRVGAVLASVGNVLLKDNREYGLEERVKGLERSAETAKDSPASSSLCPV